MVAKNEILELPKTLAEFMLWEPEDGFKYGWNDGRADKIYSNEPKTTLYLRGSK